MITLSEEATKQLKKILQEEENDPNLGLRVFVAGGGCSGYQYQMVLENEIRDGDEITEAEGVKVYVDQFSSKYLEGAEIDFVNSLMGGGFTVHNPNAVSSCSCGHSFDTGDGAGMARACGH
ncbi:MAG TPA: iron-sulfur cluster insertion protein ErpA [Chloroflexia bacterium]|nr:iron-sulfur cluster insertion protein ErpA [Chloroflexia bacterium]